MKISCIQLNVRAGQPEVNFLRVEALVQRAAKRKPDVILLPELWNTGFAPKKIDRTQADVDGARTKAEIGKLAREHRVNIVAGSVLTQKGGALYNTAYVFDRAGDCIAEYDKTHLFSPSGEGETYAAGDKLVTFPLDGVTCGILICYDLRFGELSRALALSGAKVLFIPAEWRKVATEQMLALLRARAIEEQVFAALCNGCGEADGTTFGGMSAIVDPLGKVLARAGRTEKMISAEIDFAEQEKVRQDLPVFFDRRPELYGAISRRADRQ
jgi:predicted amidohydrolase